MISSADTFSEHARTWGDDAAFAALPRLVDAVRAAIEAGDGDPAHVINYAAILLDLHRDDEALNWLLEHPLGYREYFENLATAYAKTDPSNKGQIRSNNHKSRNFPRCPNAILAYIDYLGL